MYSVAIAPIAVGTAVAYAKTGLFDAQSFFTFLGSAVLIIAWLNLSNDVFDDFAMNVGKSEIAAAVTVSQLLVVNSHLM